MTEAFFPLSLQQKKTFAKRKKKSISVDSLTTLFTEYQASGRDLSIISVSKRTACRDHLRRRITELTIIERDSDNRLQISRIRVQRRWLRRWLKMIETVI